MNILSIDWDYFIGATAEYKAEYFPDGGNENILPWLQNVIWQSRYAQSIVQKKDIRQIKVRKEYESICEYLEYEGIPLREIAESHKNCYHFISELQKSTKYGEINVTNIDFHSDLRKANSHKVDCGNWLRMLKDERVVNKITWIGLADSEELEEKDYEVQFTTDLSSQLVEGKYSAVFICRSRVWSPPHLDDKLFRLCNIIDRGNPITEGWKIEARWNDIKAGLDEHSNELKKILSPNSTQSGKGL